VVLVTSSLLTQMGRNNPLEQ